jgi:hypothetical protein
MLAMNKYFFKFTTFNVAQVNNHLFSIKIKKNGRDKKKKNQIYVQLWWSGLGPSDLSLFLLGQFTVCHAFITRSTCNVNQN